MNIRQLGGKTPATVMTGDTSDISSLTEFGWYDWVWYVNPGSQPSTSQDGLDDPSMINRKLGRYLGPDLNVGDAMTGSVLTERGQVIQRTSIIPLSPEEVHLEATKKQKEIFEKVLIKKLGDRA